MIETEPKQEPAHLAAAMLDQVEEGIDSAFAQLTILSRNTHVGVDSSKLRAVIGILDQLSQDIVGLEFDTLEKQSYHDFYQRISSLELAIEGIQNTDSAHRALLQAKNRLELAGRVKVEQTDTRSFIVTNLDSPQ